MFLREFRHFFLGLFAFVFIGSSAEAVMNQQCAAGAHWVRAHHRRAYTRSDGTFVSATFVKAHCQGNPQSFEVWNPRLKSGFPPVWEHKTEKSKEWAEDERERVLEALSVLPDALLVKSVEGIYRLGKCTAEALNPAAGYKNYVALYDEAFSPKQNLSRILAHEFAHKLYGQFIGTDRGEIYDWIQKRYMQNSR